MQISAFDPKVFHALLLQQPGVIVTFEGKKWFRLDHIGTLGPVLARLAGGGITDSQIITLSQRLNALGLKKSSNKGSPDSRFRHYISLPPPVTEADRSELEEIATLKATIAELQDQVRALRAQNQELNEWADKLEEKIRQLTGALDRRPARSGGTN